MAARLGKWRRDLPLEALLVAHNTSQAGSLKKELLFIRLMSGRE